MFAVFNRPDISPVRPDGCRGPGDNGVESGSARDALTEFILDSFRSCQDRSVIIGSMFHWTDVVFTTRLKQIILAKNLTFLAVAGDESTSVPLPVQSFFDSHVQGGVWERRPLGRRNHDKWLLFMSLDFDKMAAADLPVTAKRTAPTTGVRPALYVSTGNLSTADHDKHNAAVLVPVGPRVICELTKRYVAMARAYEIGAGSSASGFETSFPALVNYVEIDDELVKVYLFPRGESKDTVRGILKNIAPEKRQDGQSCKIQIANNRWSREGVAEELKILADKGALVEVVARSPDDRADLDGDQDFTTKEMTSQVATILKGCAFRFWQQHKRNCDGSVKTISDIDGTKIPQCTTSIHSKYMLIEAPYKTESGAYEQQKLVWVGSPNMVESSVNGSFEILLKIKNDSVMFDEFRKDFEYLKKHATDDVLPPN